MTKPEIGQQWHTTIYAILPHPADNRVLVWANGETGYTLPYATIEDATRWVSTRQVLDCLQTILPTPVNLLHRPYYQEDEAERAAQAIYLLEAKVDLAPEPGVWITAAELPQVAAPQQAVLQTYFDEVTHNSIPAQRPLWAQPGWYAETAAWIEAQLAQAGHQVTAIEPVRTWSLSCVLRAQTEQGDFYFKAVTDSPLFVNEGVILQKLAPAYPHHIPLPLAVAAPERWFLLADAGKEIGWEATTAVKAEMLAAFGRIQVASTWHIDDLLAAGCIDRRLETLMAYVPPLFHSPEAAATLTEAELAQLHDLVPLLQTRCEQLAACEIPAAALVHGDLHPGNVSLHKGRHLFFDWTDACITHPFFDMLLIALEEDAEAQAHLRQAYLAVWTDYAPMARLLAIWQLAQPLLALHHAISYQQLTANIEASLQHELAWGVPRWLRVLLRSL